MISLKLKIDQDISLLDLLEKHFSGMSKNKLKKVFSQNRILRNGYLFDKDAQISKDEEITILKKPSFFSDITIYHEEKDLIVVEKPPFMLSVDKDNAPGNSLHSILKKKYGAVFPVHRLDKETTGVMVFALNRETKEFLGKQFEDRSVKREYLAVTDGIIKEDSKVLSFKLFEGADMKMRVDGRGKDAKTTVNVLKRLKNTSLVKCILSTGRKNQIRAHLSHIGHGIVGDSRYGTYKKKSPLFLHAQTLSFTTPSGKRLEFISPIPKHFRKKLF